MNKKKTVPIVGAGLEPRKVKKASPTVDAGPQPCKVEVNKINQQAPIGPTVGIGPKPCKVEPNNTEHQLTNQRTRSTH